MRTARSFILETGLTPNIKGPNIALRSRNIGALQQLVIVLPHKLCYLATRGRDEMAARLQPR
eukprot:6335919-Alexandrium_andersonii.AAC.1